MAAWEIIKLRRHLNKGLLCSSSSNLLRRTTTTPPQAPSSPSSCHNNRVCSCSLTGCTNIIAPAWQQGFVFGEWHRVEYNNSTHITQADVRGRNKCKGEEKKLEGLQGAKTCAQRGKFDLWRDEEGTDGQAGRKAMEWHRKSWVGRDLQRSLRPCTGSSPRVLSKLSKSSGALSDTSSPSDWAAKSHRGHGATGNEGTAAAQRWGRAVKPAHKTRAGQRSLTRVCSRDIPRGMELSWVMAARVFAHREWAVSTLHICRNSQTRPWNIKAPHTQGQKTENEVVWSWHWKIHKFTHKTASGPLLVTAVRWAESQKKRMDQRIFWAGRTKSNDPKITPWCETTTSFRALQTASAINILTVFLFSCYHLKTRNTINSCKYCVVNSQHNSTQDVPEILIFPLYYLYALCSLCIIPGFPHQNVNHLREHLVQWLLRSKCAVFPFQLVHFTLIRWVPQEITPTSLQNCFLNEKKPKTTHHLKEGAPHIQESWLP